MNTESAWIATTRFIKKTTTDTICSRLLVRIKVCWILILLHNFEYFCMHCIFFNDICNENITVIVTITVTCTWTCTCTYTCTCCLLCTQGMSRVHQSWLPNCANGVWPITRLNLAAAVWPMHKRHTTLALVRSKIITQQKHFTLHRA